MRLRLSGLAVIAAALGLGLAGPAAAAPAGHAISLQHAATMPASTSEAPASQVQYRYDDNAGGYDDYRLRYRNPREWHREREWRRGDRDWRPRNHYRPRSGFYFDYYVAPPRYAPPRRAIRAGNAHIRWCHGRYKSYRAWDNTFQPYNGPRRQCISPYS